ncbi:unnamed protein product [Durusdinium trenchii]|uniref:Pentatricopeptide repeat-containing protein n=1 Tax=Durusdinium trenchii TaxID=1381693 RepID=A0ABP0M364_9DINO
MYVDSIRLMCSHRGSLKSDPVASVRGGKKEKVGRWQEAFGFLDLIPRSELQPDIITLSALISSCEPRGEWQQALGLLTEMVDRWEIQPSDVSVNAAMTTLRTEEAPWPCALELFHSMHSMHQLRRDVISWNALLTSFLTSQQWEDVLNLFDEMLNADGVVPNAVSFRLIARAATLGATKPAGPGADGTPDQSGSGEFSAAAQRRLELLEDLKSRIKAMEDLPHQPPV